MLRDESRESMQFRQYFELSLLSPLLPPSYSSLARSLAPLTGEAEPELCNSLFYIGIRLSRQNIEAGRNKQTTEYADQEDWAVVTFSFAIHSTMN